MKAMRKQYGDKEGEKVFYASKNKGTISGVENTEESKMSYLDKVLSIDEKLETQYGKPGKLSKSADRHTTNPGESKKQHRKDATKFAKENKKMASDVTPQTGKLPDHTEYKRIGALMAEALGMVVKTVGKKVVGGMAKKAAKKGAEMAADKMKPEQEVAHSVYKQIGTVIAELRTDSKGNVYGDKPDPKKLDADKLVKKQTPEQKAETEKDPRAKSAAERR